MSAKSENERKLNEGRLTGKETNLLKIQVFSNYCQAVFTFLSSIAVAGFIALLAVLLTIYYEGVIDLLSLLVGSVLLLAIFGYFGVRRVYKIYHSDLDRIEELLSKVEKGEPLPSFEELRKKKKKQKPSRPLGVYLVILWGVVGIAFLCVMFITATAMFFHPVNVIMLVLIAIAIIGLWLMRRWGAALTVIVYSMVIAFSMHNLYLAYAYPQLMDGAFTTMFWLAVNQSIVGLVTGTLIVLYLFKSIFKGIFH